MRLAVGGEQAAIEPGKQTELRQLLRQPLPLLPGLVAEAGGATGGLRDGSRLGIVQAALAGVAAQPDDIAGQGLSATHWHLTLDIGDRTNRARRHPWAAPEVKSKKSTIRSIFLWLCPPEEALIDSDKSEWSF